MIAGLRLAIDTGLIVQSILADDVIQYERNAAVLESIPSPSGQPLQSDSCQNVFQMDNACRLPGVEITAQNNGIVLLCHFINRCVVK